MPQDKTQSLAESAARELAIKLSRYLDEDSGYNDLIPDIENALKRCRNEALEEAIRIADSYEHNVADLYAAEIVNLKEAE